MEEEEKNEWGPRGQPSASEQLKISGYTEENKEEYVPKAIRAKQDKMQKAWDNPYFVEAYKIVQENPLNFKSILTQNQKNLLDYYGYDSYKDGDTEATGINAVMTLGPFAAKIPALAALVKAHPGKAFTTVMQGVGAHDIVNKPEDLAFETLGQKMDTMGNLATLNTRGMLVTGKELVKKIDDWVDNSIYGKFTKGWEDARLKIAGDGIGNLDNAKPLQSTSNTPLGGGSTKFIHSVYPRSNVGLLKQLKQQNLLGQAEKILKDLDAFKNTEGKIQRYAKWNPKRPTTGFKGNRTVKYIDSAGNPSEVAFRWSESNKTYVPYDLVKRQNTILKRLRWNVNRSPKAKWYSDKLYKIAKEDNYVLRNLLTELRKNDPQFYFDIMGDTAKYAESKGFIFVEHIHAQNSPYWKYYTKQKFKPRDTGNLMIVKNEQFGKLKTSIENEIYNNKNFYFPEGKRLLLDYDKKRDVLVLKQLQDNGNLKWYGDISPITNPRDWRKALDAALRGHKILPGKEGEIQQVIQANTDIDPAVDVQHGITKYKDPRY